MLVPFLVVGQASVDAVLNRYAKFMTQWTTVAVDVRARTSFVSGEGVGRIILVKPNKTSFSMTWGVAQYSYIQGDRRIVELERSGKGYRDYMSFDTFVAPPGNVSEMAEYGFPNMLFSPDLRKGSGLSNFRLLKATPGARAQTIGATWRAVGQPVEYEFKIDELGRPLQIRSIAPTPNGKTTTDHYFSNWAVDRKYPSSLFAGSIPAGFKAMAMPQDPFPLAVEEAFPAGDWIDMQSNRVIVGRPLASGGLGIVAVVDGQCSPSKKLIDFLSRSKGDLKVPINLIWSGNAKNVAGFSSFTSRGKSALDRLRLSSTPAIFVVDGNGTVKMLWEGFHPSQEAPLKKGILAAAKP